MELYGKAEESLLPQYLSETDQMLKFRTVDTVLVCMWLCAHLQLHEGKQETR